MARLLTTAKPPQLVRIGSRSSASKSSSKISKHRSARCIQTKRRILAERALADLTLVVAHSSTCCLRSCVLIHHTWSLARIDLPDNHIGPNIAQRTNVTNPEMDTAMIAASTSFSFGSSFILYIGCSTQNLYRRSRSNGTITTQSRIDNAQLTLRYRFATLLFYQRNRQVQSPSPG